MVQRWTARSGSTVVCKSWEYPAMQSTKEAGHKEGSCSRPGEKWRRYSEAGLALKGAKLQARVQTQFCYCCIQNNAFWQRNTWLQSAFPKEDHFPGLHLAQLYGPECSDIYWNYSLTWRLQLLHRHYTALHRQLGKLNFGAQLTGMGD